MRDEPASSRSRIRLGYSIELKYEAFGRVDFIFMIHAARTSQQRVLQESVTLTPGVAYRVDVDGAFGNRLLRTKVDGGPLHLRYASTVEVAHHLTEPAGLRAVSLAELPAPTLRFLLPSRYCQVDKLQAFAWREFGGVERGYAQVKAVVEGVRARTRFQVGASTVDTAAVDTLREGAGVCRDFAHLTIALLRALNYPARFVTAVDYGANPELGPPDFHAYVETFLGGRWYLFDPTGISPTTGLIRIATGRDAADVSFATLFGAVRSGVPKVAFAAAEDISAGIVRPAPTSLAVSTAQL